MHNSLLDGLTDIECEMLTWLAAGRSNNEIALLRGKSVSTVRNQLNALYRKLEISTRAEAIGLALRQPMLGRGQ